MKKFTFLILAMGVLTFGIFSVTATVPTQVAQESEINSGPHPILPPV